jgi:hypothetical protein
MRSHRRGHRRNCTRTSRKNADWSLLACLAACRRPQTVRCCLSLPVPLPLEQNPRAAGSVFSAVFNSGWSARQTELSCLVGRIANQPSPPLRFNRFKARLLPESQDFSPLFVLPHLPYACACDQRPPGHHAPSASSSSSSSSTSILRATRGRRILLLCYYVLINRRSLVFLCSSASGIPSGRSLLAR